MAAVSIDFGVLRAETRAAAQPMNTIAVRKESFSAIARAHEPSLVAFAMRLAGNADDARDLVQDTLERGLRRFDSFTEGTNARAWLFSILHNAFIDRCRRRAAEPKRASIDDVDVAGEEPSDPPAWTAITREQLRVAISGLEPDFRVVYELHAIEGLAYQEIAARLGLPVNTVGTRLARARKKLRSSLEALVGGGTQ